MQQLGITRIHNRGLHYAILSAQLPTPDGMSPRRKASSARAGSASRKATPSASSEYASAVGLRVASAALITG